MIYEVCIFISYPIFQVSSVPIVETSKSPEIGKEEKHHSSHASHREQNVSPQLFSYDLVRLPGSVDLRQKKTTNRIYFGDHHLDEGESSGETSLVEDLLHRPPPWHVLLWSVELAVLN